MISYYDYEKSCFLQYTTTTLNTTLHAMQKGQVPCNNVLIKHKRKKQYFRTASAIILKDKHSYII